MIGEGELDAQARRAAVGELRGVRRRGLGRPRDRPLTIHDVTFVADVGAIINPVAHQGQIDGGFLMGLGHALTEELVVEDGRIVNLLLSEYKLPCQLDMPPFHSINLEPDGGPGAYGARAAGEFNTAGVAAGDRKRDLRRLRRTARPALAHRRTHLRRAAEARRRGLALIAWPA